MTRDIVERLRDWPGNSTGRGGLNEAADEIESLRSKLDTARTIVTAVQVGMLDPKVGAEQIGEILGPIS